MVEGLMATPLKWRRRRPTAASFQFVGMPGLSGSKSPGGSSSPPNSYVPPRVSPSSSGEHAGSSQPPSAGQYHTLVTRSRITGAASIADAGGTGKRAQVAQCRPSTAPNGACAGAFSLSGGLVDDFTADSRLASLSRVRHFLNTSTLAISV